MENPPSNTTRCAGCHLVLKIDLSRIPRRACPRCGARSRIYEIRIADQVGVVDFTRIKYRAAGMRKGYRDIVIKTGKSWSRDRQKYVDFYQRADDIAHWIKKRVYDPDTGEVIREVDESYADHHGRGDAKRKKP